MIHTIIHWYVCQFIDQYGPIYYGISFIVFLVVILIDQILRLVRYKYNKYNNNNNNNLQTYHYYIQLFGSRGMAAVTTLTTNTTTTTSTASTSSNTKKRKSLLMVPKSWFRYFYIIATINVCIVSYYIFFVVINMQQEQVHQQDQQQEEAIIIKPTMIRITIGYLIVLVLYSIHVCRRVYENYFVHKYSDTTTNKIQMHLIIFIGGLLYYTFLPCVLLLYVPFLNDNNSCCTSVTTTSNDITDMLTPFPEATTNKVTITSISSLFIVGSFNIVCQYEQYYHHVILASLRNTSSSIQQSSSRTKKDDDNDDTTKIQEQRQQQSPIYKIPYGGLFKYVSCPHYFFEILIYISFGMLLYIDNRLAITNEKQQQQEQQRNNNSTTTKILTLLLNDCSVYRYWLLLGFIIFNLCYSANDTHIAYSNRFTTTYTTLNRKRIFPGIF